MPEQCNRRPKCENERYGENEKCIYHCDKSTFNDRDIKNFWEKLRQDYQLTWHIDKDITFENIHFPSFQNSSYLPFNFFQNNRVLGSIFTFKKCIFYGDINFIVNQLRQEIIFDECIFNGNIQTRDANIITIIHCELKHEITTLQCNSLHIHKTKFLQNAIFNINNIINISDCTFSKEAQVIGSSSPECMISNVQFKQKILMQNCGEVTLSSIDFNHDVTFQRLQNLKLIGSSFSKKVIFENTANLEIDHTRISNLTLTSIQSLKLINESTILGTLGIEGESQSVFIENSQVDKKLELKNVKEFTCKSMKVFGSTQLEGKYDVINIESSQFEDILIHSTSNLTIIQSVINKFCHFKGKEYKSIVLQESEFNGSLIINETEVLELSSVASKSTLTLPDNKYGKILFKNAIFQDVEISSSKDFLVSKSKFDGNVNFYGDDYEVFNLDTAIFKKSCSFPKSQIHYLSGKSCQFYEDITFCGGNEFTFVNVKFKKTLKLIGEYGDIKFERCDVKENFALVSFNAPIELKSCLFQGNIDFSKSNIPQLVVRSSCFEKKFDLSDSTFISIDCEGQEDERYPKNQFLEGVNFSKSKHQTIHINHCLFENSLVFHNVQGICYLSDISNSVIKKLEILNSTVARLFANSENLQIGTCSLESIKLDNGDDDIMIKKLQIEEFLCDKISIPKALNLTDMEIKKFRISNCNFEYSLRIKYSDIEIFNLISNTFEDLQIIENHNDDFSKIRELRLKNTTIKNAVFDKLRYDKFIMNDAHVSGAKIGFVKFKEGSRETNRFFKNYYDSISDYIQANEYYKQEMIEQYKVTQDKGERFILFWGRWISNFGQSWLRPLLWALLVTILCYRIANYELLSLSGFRENHIAWMINDILKFANPLNSDSKANYGLFYWAWMFHKLIMSALLYHFVVAVKRKTRR